MKLKTGCYLMSFKPMVGDRFGQLQPPCIGTLRITGGTSTIPFQASGDLYSLSVVSSSVTSSANPQTQDLSQRVYGAGPLVLPNISIFDDWKARAVSASIPIPHFAMEGYRYYLEVHALDVTAQGLALDTTAHEYVSGEKRLVARGRMPILLEAASDGTAYQGYLINGDERRGEFYLQWISDDVRSAELRLFAITPDGSPAIALPGENPAKMTAALAKARRASRSSDSAAQRDGVDDARIPGWEELFSSIGWDLTVTKPATDALPGGFRPKEWAAFDLSNAGRVLRQARMETKDENGEIVEPHAWFYDLLCVPRFESPVEGQAETPTDGRVRGKVAPSEYLGIMFDTEATDLNQQPRESAAVAALQVVQDDGEAVPFQEVLGGAAYYRTALHEVGHTMNLTHNFQGSSLMNTTGRLLQLPVPAKRGQQAVPFRFDVDWKFSPEDAEWLQHAPDIAVRPGGISRRGVRLRKGMRPVPGPILLKAASDLILTVRPVEKTFPFGAPVRLDYDLYNRGSVRNMPKDISLRGGCVMGRVTGPDQVTRFFRSAFRCCDTAATEARLQSLPGNHSLASSMTILRGIDGPLFPEAGVYRIEVEIRWDADGQTNRAVGHSGVTVTPAIEEDPAQSIAAALILNSSAMMPALVQGLIDEEGLRALSVALRSTELAPHYLPTALKCKIMGTRRGIVWKDRFNYNPAPIDLTLSQRSTPAPLPSSSMRAMHAAGQEASPGAERKIVQTRREQTQLEAELKSAGPARTSARLLKKISRNEVVVSADTNAWLDEVRNLTVPNAGDDLAVRKSFPKSVIAPSRRLTGKPVKK